MGKGLVSYNNTFKSSLGAFMASLQESQNKMKDKYVKIHREANNDGEIRSKRIKKFNKSKKTILEEERIKAAYPSEEPIILESDMPEKLNMTASKRVVISFCDAMAIKNNNFLKHKAKNFNTKNVTTLMKRVIQSKKVNLFTGRYLENVKRTFEDLKEVINE